MSRTNRAALYVEADGADELIRWKNLAEQSGMTLREWVRYHLNRGSVLRKEVTITTAPDDAPATEGTS